MKKAGAMKHPIRSTLFILFIIVSFFCSKPMLAQHNMSDPLNIAVLDFDASGFTQQEAVALTNHFRSYLVNTRYFVVLERGKMEEICKEIGFQLSGCTSSDCVVEAGKILNVQKMAAGNIGKVGETYTINVSLIDVGSTRIEESFLRTHQGQAEGLLDILREIALEMSHLKIKRMSAIPLYAAVALTAVSAGGGVYSFLQKEDSYDKYKAARTSSEMKRFKDETQKFNNYVIYSAAVAGGSIISYLIYRHYYEQSKTQYVSAGLFRPDRQTIGVAVCIRF